MLLYPKKDLALQTSFYLKVNICDFFIALFYVNVGGRGKRICQIKTAQSVTT